ncbi:heparinase II/III family protein [Pseudoduganella plicata]|uniref:Heparinase II/III-like C-terminal domain-containing protein n=2 Tax=Pseudoduganella plicata TaxID=321984 RepID=A0ABX5SGZ3_9BURK|nr:heparinase II/III family protein [Pseudoduganella plicata]QBQ38751.1 hypothetical protein E1742_23210 [Pseudoduganella plicata]
MIRTLHARTALAATIALIWTGSSLAQMPAAVRDEHPRVLATQADLDRIRQEAAIGPLTLPAKKGKLVFTLNPKARGSNDLATADVFGQEAGTGDRFYMRYSNQTAPAGTIAVQVVGVSGGSTAFLTYLFPTVGADNKIVFEYDSDRQYAAVGLNTNNPTPLTWKTASWSPAGQQFAFFGNQGDRITDLKLFDNDTEVWRDDEVDLELHRSWRGFLTNATYTADVLAACTITTAVGNGKGCDRNAGGRSVIIEAAQRLTMAYRMTRREAFLAAARKHINYILQVTNGQETVTTVKDGVTTTKTVPTITKGGEWDTAARVGALGLYYDWLHDELGEDERKAIATAIRATIAAKNPISPNDDLVYSVCGFNQTVVTGSGSFDCQYKPTLTVVDGYKRTIADTYISGHTQAANAGVAMGLLAIGTKADGNADVKPMLDTVYDHYAKGFWPARDFYGIDGGSHTLFAYAVSGGNDTAERLTVWKRAMVALDDPATGPTQQVLPLLIYPYIYGLRGDGTYPARSDYFATDAGSPGEMAAAAVAAAGDPQAAYFYQQYSIPNRNRLKPKERMDPGMFWERMLYPSAGVTPLPLKDLPLSRYFRNAGNVLMRDTWDFADATLLEFKSSSFITVNHHHMDQNSYSLYYKAPLLLDSGMYDRYGSNHWHNYYIRSIAHNTITVFDPTETYSLGKTKELSVDGGQWPGPEREGNPELRDIQLGGKYALDGVTAFEEGGDYSYVAANASKAYVNAKLDSSAGFLRSTVYLRPRNTGEKPKVLVFDSVRPIKDDLEITSLLHSANKPTSTIAPTATEPGRYQFNFLNGVAEPLTIRNLDGMVTVQTVLPAQANVLISGGKGEGAKCAQATDPFFQKTRQDDTDCRFLVRKKTATGYQWQNFAVIEKADNIPMDGDGVNPITDMGAWRVEISPKVKPAKGSTQYFLNVLHVADNDKLERAANIEAATLLSAEDNTVAVALVDGRNFVFNGGPVPATTVKWKRGASSTAPTLVFGLVPDTRYALAQPGTDGKFVLTQSTGGAYQSSANGVLELNRQ